MNKINNTFSIPISVNIGISIGTATDTDAGIDGTLLKPNKNILKF